MKKRMKGFTGSSWGEYSNSSGRVRGGRVPVKMDSQDSNQRSPQPNLGLEPDLEINYYDPSDEIVDTYMAQEISSPCEQMAESFEYLQANPQITVENAEGFYASILKLMGVGIGGVTENIAMDNDIAPYDEVEYYGVQYAMQQMNCNTFMNGECLGQIPSYSMDYGTYQTINAYEPTTYYNAQEVANTLASALLSLNDFLYDIVEGVVVIPDAPEEPMVILGLVEEILERILELEMECGQIVPMIVEQAAGQMAEEYILFAFDNGFIELDGDMTDMTAEEFICMDEYTHSDSFSYIFEALNYTPILCGGAEGCPSCPDCGAATDCPDCNCDCPDPCPQGGGIVSELGLCSDGRKPKFDGKKYICSDGRPPQKTKKLKSNESKRRY